MDPTEAKRVFDDAHCRFSVCTTVRQSGASIQYAAFRALVSEGCSLEHANMYATEDMRYDIDRELNRL